jgi:hypothetical protein
MSPRRDSGERATAWDADGPDVRTLVDAGVLDELLSGAADAGPRELLTAATRAITQLLGERGSCILLEGQPRVVLALHRPSLADLPIDLDRYPEVRAAATTRPTCEPSSPSRSSCATDASASSSSSRRARARQTPRGAPRRPSSRA